MKHFCIQTNDLNVWRSFLADPEKQWKKGYSAYELAHSWTACEGLPSSIRGVFSNTEFENMKILYVFPEHEVYLDNKMAPSQNDLFVLGKADRDLVVIMVEGKVEEPFGELVKDWLEQASDGKRKRLAFLRETLQLEDSVNLDSIRYQLLHRTASALLEAMNLNAKKAIMLVHSFSPASAWLEDYLNLVRLFGLQGQTNQLTPSVRIHEVELSFAWVSEKANNSPL
jgi:hypothetical protein